MKKTMLAAKHIKVLPVRCTCRNIPKGHWFSFPKIVCGKQTTCYKHLIHSLLSLVDTKQVTVKTMIMNPCWLQLPQLQRCPLPPSVCSPLPSAAGFYLLSSACSTAPIITVIHFSQNEPLIDKDLALALLK